MSDGDPITGAVILDAIAACGIEFVVSVPDIMTTTGLLWPLVEDPRFRLIRVCKEDEGVSICASMSICDKRALLLIQYTGLLDSINALRAAGCQYELPVCIMTGLLEKEPGVAPAKSKNFGVRMVEPILDAMNVPHALLEVMGDVRNIRPAIDKSYVDSYPTALLIGRQI